MKHSTLLPTIVAIFKSQEPLTTDELVSKTGLSKRTIQRHTKDLLSEDLICIGLTSDNRTYQYWKAV